MSLFDGETLNGWRNYRGKGVRDGWKVVDGTLQHSKKGGDIITEQQYQDYELSLEWKISPGGNSGIFLGVRETNGPMHRTGIEMQVLDDGKHIDGKFPKHRSGACYSLYQPPAGAVGEVGTWNRVYVVKQGDHVRFFLNGVKTADFRTDGVEFRQLVAHSKFRKSKYYARHRKGHIGLQDHGDRVSYRNIKLRKLDPVPLFNGINMNGWKHYLQGDAPMNETWSVDGGIMRCEGKPTGYIFTDKNYGNYQLDLEWRWVPGRESGNSGLLIHMTPETKMIGPWPKSLEVQLQSGHAGDFWIIGEDITTPDMKQRRRGRNIRNLTDVSEKKHGQWNHMRVIARDGNVIVYVNGDLVNLGSKGTVVKGRIALQSEGSPIEFRRVDMTPLPER